MLFTEMLPAHITVADLIHKEPDHALAALETAAHTTHATLASAQLGDAAHGVLTSQTISALIALRSPQSWDRYLTRSARLPDSEHCSVVNAVTNGVHQILPSLRSLAPAPPVHYGHLQPDHILVPPGPDQSPVLFSPRLQRGSAGVDLARLISQTVLSLITTPGTPAVDQALTTLDTLLSTRVSNLWADQQAWVRTVLHLWLTDSLITLVNTVTAPPRLPLPALAQGILQHHHRIRALLNWLRTLTTVNNPRTAWTAMTSVVAELTRA
ncbi:hypothetical protein [Streptomyces sp. NPDC059003]|uniref:hypothetical protein n=1 Tax=Streptomyces sp. NPDC059003 TaxID=3346691 RepID=UPI00369BAD32